MQLNSEEMKYYLELKNYITERHELMIMYYSKIEVGERLEKELSEIKKKIDMLDKKITAWTPHKK